MLKEEQRACGIIIFNLIILGALPKSVAKYKYMIPNAQRHVYVYNHKNSQLRIYFNAK